MGKGYLLFNRWSFSEVAFFFCCLLIAGMFTTYFARLLSSIATVGLLLTALASWRFSAVKCDKRLFGCFAGFGLIYVLHLLGLLQPELIDRKFLYRDLSMKLPLVIFPLSFLLLPAISQRRLQVLYYFFLLCVFAGSLYSLGNYLVNFSEVNALYKHSKIMDTPTNHVRFSLMVAFAIVIGYRFYRQEFFFKYNWERLFILGITCWLYVFLHLLAVRSGLVAFYAVVGLGLLFDLIVRKKYKRVVLISAGLALGLMAAFYTLPTFYNRFYLTIEDMQRVSKAENAHNYSIAGRVYSYKVAMAVFQEHPVLGVGMGNLEPELDQKYSTLFPEIKERGHILPHNQFIFYLVVFGIVGTLLFMIGFYYPLLRFSPRFEPLFLIHYLIITFSFLFEATLETQVGLNYSLVFILLPLWYYKSGEPSTLSWKNDTFFA
ncbi:O-antigen ligase family protein [Adhaeribacter soli]|uniref:O-antigen ligase family protein n=1 Tax=Adhaeribacter soli TaxID=2607655 RepID=A0A5N1J3C1_9BACT|nr:O-antigen ligase family protein [Adhaeribacter soli]KAA9340595.1 O-antigen ligase family protein [Adhaeribacter soli]